MYATPLGRQVQQLVAGVINGARPDTPAGARANPNRRLSPSDRCDLDTARLHRRCACARDLIGHLGYRTLTSASRAGRERLGAERCVGAGGHAQREWDARKGARPRNPQARMLSGGAQRLAERLAGVSVGLTGPGSSAADSPVRAGRSLSARRRNQKPFHEACQASAAAWQAASDSNGVPHSGQGRGNVSPRSE